MAPSRQFSVALPAASAGEDERMLSVEIPGLATQANGEALVRLGDTVVLVTATIASTPREGVDFFPLMVDFEEKYYAAGELRTSRFMKREARPSDEAVLAGRFVDRTIRPCFPKGMRNDVQVVATTLSYDGQNDSDVLALVGASAALMVSDIPWNGPIAGVRVADLNGERVINPTEAQRKEARFEVVVSGTGTHVNMLEAGGRELSEEDVLSAIEEGRNAVAAITRALTEFAAAHGKPKASIVRIEPSDDARAALHEFLGARLEDLLFSSELRKGERMDRVNALKREAVDRFTSGDAMPARDVESLFEDEINDLVHRRILKREERPDGRKLDELRLLEARVGGLPRTHGSAVFTRGDTRSLATVTLAAPGEEQIVEGMEGEWRKPFMLHYNFPPFSVGEVKPLRGPSRRDIGHGALAERSLLAVLPSRDAFPYTIRVVSEILSSNGSSSMASVCAGSLALMDAGVPIPRHVAGIAMGLMMEPQTHADATRTDADKNQPKYKVLTDIQGPEDHHGDIDLKIAGTREGITGIQMDVKIEGVTPDILRAAFAQARKARLEILDAMEQALAAPRPSVGKYAPKVRALKINPEKIRDLIGPGGRIINGIIARTGASIDVEDSGDVYVAAIDPDALTRAVREVEDVTREAAIGERFEGTVTRIFPFGAMVELFPNHEGLVHMQELRSLGAQHPEDVFRTGMPVTVIVKEIDAQGRVNLALADPAALPKPEPRQDAPHRDRRGPPRRMGGGFRRS